jgi:hypothetical protein
MIMGTNRQEHDVIEIDEISHSRWQVPTAAAILPGTAGHNAAG